MMFRTALFALLFVALNAAAIARCCDSVPVTQGTGGGHAVGATVEHGAQHGEHLKHDRHSDCGTEGHTCPVVVQGALPEVPALAAPLIKPVDLSVASLVAVRDFNHLVSAVAHQPRPPDGGESSYKTIYARTGRLLI